jgi:hypothetical protein
MTESSDHLAQYRLILMTQSEHEPYEKRVRGSLGIQIYSLSMGSGKGYSEH